VISTEFEDRLREEMRYATADVPAPAGLVRRARRSRRRRLAVRTTAAAATAAAVAAAVIVSNGAAGAPGIYTTGYVVRHVESALDTAAAAHDIAYLRSVNGSMRAWLYDGPQGPTERSESFSPSGQLRTEVGTTVTPAGLEHQTVVDFGTRTWWRQSLQEWMPPAGQPSCSFPLYLNLRTLPVLTTDIRNALACGELTNAGTVRVDGITALKLVSVRTLAVTVLNQGPPFPATLDWTLWVDPASYLPVRFGYVSTDPRLKDGQPGFDIRWLPPTSANLAQLTMTIPPGFTQVAPPN